MLFRITPKPLIFATFGAAGCLLGALFGEGVLTVLMPPLVRGTAVDVLFVLDITGSMRNEIDGVKKGIASFVSSLGQREVRVGLIAFGDECNGEPSRALPFGTGAFTSDTKAFGNAVGGLALVHGDDDPESSLDALILGSRQVFAPSAVKVMVLITDAPPHVRGDRTDCTKAFGELIPTVEDTITALQKLPLNQLHLVVDPESEPAFASLHEAIRGRVFTLEPGGRQNFAEILPEIGQGIATAIGTGPVDSGQSQRVLIATALWTALLAIGTFQLLIVGQNAYLRRTPLTFDPPAIRAILGVIAAGGVAGALGQWLSAFAGSSASLGIFQRLIIWAILGAVLSRGIALFIPNLEPRRAYLGGVLGGALGAAGFVLAAQWAFDVGFHEGVADMFGRLLGATLLGFLIGLMISIVEIAFREAWLEIRYGPKEVRTVNLGPEPVSFGADPAQCTIYAPDTAPKAYSYRLQQGQVICEDLAAGRQEAVPSGSSQMIGNLHVTVRGGGVPATSASTTAGARQAPIPSPSRRPAPAPAGFALRLSASRVYPLARGGRLTAREIPGLEPGSADGVVAEVSQNPKDPGILGLKNRSQRTWEVHLPDGGQRRIAEGQSVRLAEGSRIAFGTVEGDIIRNG